MDKLPKFTKLKIEEPVEGERYLVYRVGSTSWYSPHYTIRKYHNGSFGSKDVKYWIKLSEVMEHEFNMRDDKSDILSPFRGKYEQNDYI